jgi:SOS-response transcriptional repressor LexA
MKKITKRQFEIAGFIRDFIGKNTISPTLYDIAEYFSIKPSTAAAHIAALERKRVIVRQKGRRRSIRPVGMGSSLPQKVPVCVPFYLKNNSFSSAPTSFYHVDASLLPEHVRAKDLFAVRLGVFNGLPADSDMAPGDILIVWTRPERLYPGMVVLERTGSAPTCRQIKAESNPAPDVVGQVIALLRPLK